MHASAYPLGCSFRNPTSGHPSPATASLLVPADVFAIRSTPLSACYCRGFNVDVVRGKKLPQISASSRVAVDIAEPKVRVGEKKARLHERIEEVRAMVQRIGEGDINVSPYDTAWVALVRDVDGDSPRFPLALQWIAEHQLPDGSWGDASIFEPHDRMLNTLACAIALASYCLYPQHHQRGMVFLRENMHLIGEGNEEHMPIGFEIAFPSLLDMAREMGLDLPFHAPCLQRIFHNRGIKMERIPLALMHEVPSTLLFTLEGMVGRNSEDLDWKRLLRFQCPDGSFFFSPSSTAFAVIRTGDAKSLGYLENVTARFNGGVPNVYPVDLFEHMWAVDRLQRLGIARYFQREVKQCLDYAYKYWTSDGIGWARRTNVPDIDDSSMGFRLLRLHGYHVSADVFSNFRKGEEFCCFPGQSSQAVTGMFNFNRAANVAFPGEEILDAGRKFSGAFLRSKLSGNEQFADKWIIAKDLKGEVEYALEFPFLASLPRVEARIYLEQYGGEDDVWIGKALYRMALVNNNAYLDLARADFNRCQAVHQREWIGFRRWFGKRGLSFHGVSRQRLLEAYFLAVCSVFEPERSAQRLGWARQAVLLDAVRSYLTSDTCTDEMKRDFLNGLRGNVDRTNRYGGSNQIGRSLLGNLRRTIKRISLDAAAGAETRRTTLPVQGDRIERCLENVWEDWIMSTVREDGDDDALFFCRTLELSAGRYDLEEAIALSSATTTESSTDDDGDATGRSKMRLLHAAALVSSVCRRLRRYSKDEMTNCKVRGSGEELDCLEEDGKKLLQCVTDNLNADDRETMQTFLTVARTLYYVYRCPVETMNIHIDKVLFEKVV